MSARKRIDLKTISNFCQIEFLFVFLVGEKDVEIFRVSGGIWLARLYE